LELVEAAKNRLHRPTLPGLGPPGKGRAAYLTEGLGLPPAAREEAEQREHENDDQDDPQNAQSSHLLPASFAKYGSPSQEGALNPSTTCTARGRALVGDAAGGRGYAQDRAPAKQRCPHRGRSPGTGMASVLRLRSGRLRRAEAEYRRECEREEEKTNEPVTA
jgi:hypothetical protein